MNERIYYSTRAERIAKRQRMLVATLFMALGLTVGALLALLFAPQSGEKMRKAITGEIEGGLKIKRSRGNGTRHRIEDEYRNLRREVDSLLSNVKR